MNPKKIRYGITRSVKGRYFDLALYHFKYIYAIKYPDTFVVKLGGRFGQMKSNNIRIFKKLKVIYKLTFDPKNQWLTKFAYIHTIKPSLQCCEHLQYIGLNIIKNVKRLESFDYNFPNRLSFDQNKLKDINYLKYSKVLKNLKLHIGSFDNQNMYKKLFRILKRQTQLELAIFIRMNLELAKPYMSVIEKIPQLKLTNEIELEHLINQNKQLTNITSLASFTAQNCLEVLNNFDLFTSLKRLELNDFVIPVDRKSNKELSIFQNIKELQQLETLIFELNFTRRSQANLFFQNFAAPTSIKTLELTLFNIDFSFDNEEAETKLLINFGNFCQVLESFQQMANLKMCFTIFSHFKFINRFIGDLPINLPQLQNLDCLFRTENEFDNSIFVDIFLKWANNLKSLSKLTLRTTNFTIKNEEKNDISLPSLKYLRLTEEFGRKPKEFYDGESQKTVNYLTFLQNHKSLEQIELNLNFSDLALSFEKVLFELLFYLPRSLKSLKLRIVNKKEINLDQENIRIQISTSIERLNQLRALELNLPVFFQCDLKCLNQYQHLLIPGVWKENASGIIYYW